MYGGLLARRLASSSIEPGRVKMNMHDFSKLLQDDDIVPGLYADGSWAAARGFGRGSILVLARESE